MMPTSVLRSPARGFTLIELVVVLVILALLTHLAVREMGKVQASHRRRQADRQLEEVRAAVWAREPGGAASGFLMDLGRLPRAVPATNEAGRVVQTLAELWQRPAGVAPFALRTAAATNLVVPASVQTALADETVVVPCGWRGPYLRLPFGRTRLLDAWGNPFETRDDAGFVRLFTSAGEPAAQEGDAIGRVRHLGADARPDDRITPSSEAARDGVVDFLPPGGRINPLAVTAQFVNGAGPVGIDGTVRCRWYMPCGGAITGDVATVTLTEGSFATFSFNGLPPGACTLVVDVGGRKRAQETVEVPPGGRTVQMKVWVP